jgi:hypothetical protein
VTGWAGGCDRAGIRPSGQGSDRGPIPLCTYIGAVSSPTPPATDGGAVDPPVRRLGRVGLIGRLAALALGTVLVVHGTVFGNDVQWPFAPMAQFAFRVGPDDSIRSLYLAARTVQGQDIVVPLSPPNLGIGRAEVEGQLPAIQRDPRLLKDLIEPYPRLHPGAPALAQVWLRERVTVLKNGRANGEYVETLVGWPVDQRGRSAR